MLDECQNKLFDLQSKQDHQKDAITDEIDLLITNLD